MKDGAVLDVVDGIYATSLNRFAWPEALRRVAELVGAATTMLLTPARVAPGWRIAAASGLPDELVHAYNSRWGDVDPFLAETAGAPSADLTVRHLRGDAASLTPFGQFFCNPAGFQAGLLARSRESGGSALMVWRPTRNAFESAEVEMLRALWPHVSRALAIQAASGHHGGDAIPPTWAESFLDLWHIALVGFSNAGRQVYANRAARQLASRNDGLSFAVDGPVASSVAQTRLLRELIHQLSAGGLQGPQWLRLKRTSGARSYEVALIRTPAAGRDGPVVAMLASAPDLPVACHPGALHHLHGLTELEASIAGCLVEAMPIADMAPALDLSLHTTRWYVQQVREKLDAASQGHAIRSLLRGLASVDWH